MVKESRAMKKEVISVWKDSGSSLNDSRPQKEEYDVWKYNHGSENNNVKVKRITKLIEREVSWLV